MLNLLINSVKLIPFALISLTFGVIAAVSSLFLKFAQAILKGIISPAFTSLPYTKPGPIAQGGNPIIETGLAVTQGFANMALVLILVFIALSIILRLKDYEAKKILPAFIIIALLVNFAPVLCGLVVDASNIIMYYFLDKIGNLGNFVNFLVETYNQYEATSGFFSTSASLNALIFKYSLITLFNILTLFAFFIFAFIFIARYVAIWILVILSPLAFACYILPQTRSWAGKWWKQLVHWSFIGIPCAFFLYLAEQIMFLPRVSINPVPEIGSEILPLLVPLAFIYLALGFGLATGAMGASQIIDWGKTAGKKAGAWAGKRAVGFAKENMPEEVRKTTERMAVIKRWGQEEKGFGGWAKRTISAPVYHAIKGLGNVLGGDVAESQQEEIKKQQEKLKGKTLQTQKSFFNKAVRDSDKIAALNAVIEDNNFDKFKKENNLSDDEIVRLINKSKKWDAHKTLQKANPHLADKFISNTELTDANAKNPDILTKEGVVVSKMKSNDYKNLSEEARNSQKVIDAILAQSSGKNINTFIEEQGQPAAIEVEKAIDRGAYINSRAFKYLTSQAAQGLITPTNKIKQWNRNRPKFQQPPGIPVPPPPPGTTPPPAVATTKTPSPVPPRQGRSPNPPKPLPPPKGRQTGGTKKIPKGRTP